MYKEHSPAYFAHDLLVVPVEDAGLQDLDILPNTLFIYKKHHRQYTGVRISAACLCLLSVICACK